MGKKKSKKKTIIVISIIVVVLIGLGIALALTRGDKSVKVTTSKVERRTITQVVTAVGKIKPETLVKISSETSGEIIYLGVKEGDTVRQGQVIVRIKPDIIETQLDQAKSAIEAAKTDIDSRKSEMDRTESDLKRQSDLYKNKYISSQDYDKAKAAYDQAKAGYESSIKNYDKYKSAYKEIEYTARRTTIVAPIDGIVTSLSVEKGEKVVGTAQMSGTEIMQIADLHVINAVVEVDENDIIMVKKGDTAEIEVDAISGKKFKGYVIEIGHSAVTSSSGTQDQVINFEVKVRLIDNETRFRPGMSCNVDIQTETHRNVVAVPLQAVTVRASNGGKVDLKSDVSDKDISVQSDNDKKTKQDQLPSVVFIKKGNKAKLVNVKTGLSDKGFIEITSGLNGDEEIISGTFQAISKELNDNSAISIDSGKVIGGKLEKK